MEVRRRPKGRKKTRKREGDTLERREGCEKETERKGWEAEKLQGGGGEERKKKKRESEREIRGLAGLKGDISREETDKYRYFSFGWPPE